MQKKYIIQRNCKTCNIITLLNAQIHIGRKPTFTYMSKEYIDFIVDKLKGFYSPDNKEVILNYHKIGGFIKLAKEHFGIKLSKIRHKTVKEFKENMIKALAKGKLIDFHAYTHSWHSFLIADYDKEGDSFMCIGANLFTFKSVIEWIPFEILIHAKIKPSDYKMGSINYSHTSNYCMSKRNSSFVLSEDSKTITFKT